MTEDDPNRALHAPFTLAQDWDPIPGTCSRCKEPALCDEGRWWHDGPACRANGPIADFIPD